MVRWNNKSKLEEIKNLYKYINIEDNYKYLFTTSTDNYPNPNLNPTPNPNPNPNPNLNPTPNPNPNPNPNLNPSNSISESQSHNHNYCYYFTINNKVTNYLYMRYKLSNILKKLIIDSNIYTLNNYNLQSKIEDNNYESSYKFISSNSSQISNSFSE